MTTYPIKRKLRRRDDIQRRKSAAGVAARAAKRMAQAEAMRDIGGFVTDGALGVHTVRLLAYPEDTRSVAVTVDGTHRQPRTLEGVRRCMAEMVVRRSVMDSHRKRA